MTSTVSVAASNVIQLSDEILCPRTARLTAGGLSGLLLTDGARTAYLDSAASIAGWQEHVFTQAPVASTSPSAQAGGKSKARTPPAPVHFVSLSPDLQAAPCQPTTTASSSLPPRHLAAVSTGTQLQVISLGSGSATANPSQRSQGPPEAMGAAAKAGAGRSLGVLAAPQPFTWLNVSWLAVTGSNRGGGGHGSNSNRSTRGEASGGPAAGATAQPTPGGARACHCLLAAVCQAELRVVLCDPAAATAAPTETATAAPDEKAESSAVTSTPASAPHSRCGLRTVGQLLPPPSLAAGGGGGAAPVCRSSQCHVAWVGDCADGAGAVVTLVAAWGADIEVVGWVLRDLLVAPAAPTASTGAGAAAAGVAAALPPPASRRTLLLGVPGPLSAVAPGPWGSVVAATSAALALALTTAPEPPACAAADSDAAAEMDGAISSPGDEAAAVVAAAAAGAPAAPEVLDLRGRLVGGDGGGELLGGGIIGGCGGGDVGPSPAGLFNISSLAAEEAEAGGAAAAARRPVGVLGGAASSAGSQCRAVPGNSSPSLGAVPGRFLLGDAVAAAPPAALCVVWPGRLASPSAPTLSASSSSSSSRPLDAFRALAPLSIPRPDLIAACSGGCSSDSTGGTSSMSGSSGSLVLVGSSMGPPLVAAFGLTPRGGLTPLMTLSPALPPGALDPARGRLRGLALAPAARGGSGAGGGGGAGGGTGVALVVVVGESEPAVAGAGIVGFGKAPGAGAPAVRLAPLLASVHTLPPQLAAHAAPPLPPPPAPSQPVTPAPAATQAASALTSAPAPAAVAPAPAAPPPAAAPADVVAAAVVGQLAELLEGLRRHVDSRLDELSGSVQAQAVRLERLEASVLEKQQQEQKQQK